MTWTEFWKDLERRAVPSVQAEVEKRGWKLTNAESHFFSAERNGAVWTEHGDGPFVPHARAMTVSDLLERIAKEESRIRKSPAGIEIIFNEEDA